MEGKLNLTKERLNQCKKQNKEYSNVVNGFIEIFEDMFQLKSIDEEQLAKFRTRYESI